MNLHRIDTSQIGEGEFFNCCNHACSEGRECPNREELDWVSVGMYACAAVFAVCIVALAVIGLRWILNQI